MDMIEVPFESRHADAPCQPNSSPAADRPVAPDRVRHTSEQYLNAPQRGLAECLELASEVAKHPPNHARGRAARDRYLTMCLDSR
jgi:hypothetical protein